MVPIDEIRKAIASTIKEATGIQTDPYSPNKLNPPCAFAGTHEMKPDDTSGGRTLIIYFWVTVPAANTSKQKDLDELLVKVVDAIDGDPYLGRDEQDFDASALGWDDYGDFPGPGAMWGAKVAIEVLVSS